MNSKTTCGISSPGWSDSTVKTLDLPSDDLERVRQILSANVPGREIWAFGSRVCGKARKFSDLDLAIVGSQPLPTGVMADLRDAFCESDLPMKIDLIDLATTEDYFRRIIERHYIVLQEGRQNTPAAIVS